MTTLPSIIHEPIQALVDAGDALFDKGKFEAALAKYSEAYALLPSDKERWEATTWVLAAIGDASFQIGDFASAETALAQAITCPEGADNPFLHLRLGQCAFELGRMELASEALAHALEVAGEEVFEDEDPKYRALLPEIKAGLDS